MRYLLPALAIVVAAVFLGAGYLWRRLRKLAAQQETAEFMEHLDDGLAIPMRDSDTRPRHKPSDVGPPSGSSSTTR